MDDFEVIDVSLADDDIISVTCDDDFDEDDETLDEIREKFRTEREIKKEKNDDYPDFDVITTHLPGSKSLPSSCPHSQNSSSKLGDPPNTQDEVKTHGEVGVKNSTSGSHECKKVGSDKSSEKGSDVLKSKDSDEVKKKGSIHVSSKPSKEKDSVKADVRKVAAVETKKRKQDTLRSVPRKKIFVPVDEGNRGAPGLEEKTEFLWRKMRRIQHQNRQLYQLIEKLCTGLNDKTCLNQAALYRVREDYFSGAHLTSQGNLQHYESIAASSSTGPPWPNQGAYCEPQYSLQNCDVNNRMVCHRPEEDRAVYGRPVDEYVTFGRENNSGVVGLLENGERFSSVVPSYREEHCTPQYNRVPHTVPQSTLLYRGDFAANQEQVVRNQMISDPLKLEGSLSRRILGRETALQHPQEQCRHLEASYEGSCNTGSYPGLYYEGAVQSFEPPLKRKILVHPRMEVNQLEFDEQNSPVMGGVMHGERVVRKRPILHRSREHHPPLSRGPGYMAPLIEMEPCRDVRQVEHERRAYPSDVRSVQVGSGNSTFNQLAVESLEQSRFWQGEQFFGRRA